MRKKSDTHTHTCGRRGEGGKRDKGKRRRRRRGSLEGKRWQEDTERSSLHTEVPGCLNRRKGVGR